MLTEGENLLTSKIVEEHRRGWFDRFRRTRSDEQAPEEEALLLLGKDKQDVEGIAADVAVDVALHSMPQATAQEPAQPAVADEGGEPSAVDTFSFDDSDREAEAQLVAQAKLDPKAFGVLYESYVDRIYSYIYHRVGNTQDAEDLTARTFYRALDKLDSYEDRGLPFSAWLFRIAHNLIANWHRDRSRRSFLSLDRIWSYGNNQTSPETQVEDDEKHEALWSAISRLPEERKNLLLFKFGSQLSNLEIGKLMDKSESAIKSLYFRTLAALREDLEARGWGNAQGPDTHHEAPLQAEHTDSSGGDE
jgi:RNA polymerase sigma-70 factor, ECF subfamily